MTTAAPAKGITTYKPSAKAVTSIGVCVYGVGGSGKTSLLRTMPGAGLVVDVPQVEGGTFVLEDAADRIDVTSVYEWNDIEKVYWTLKNTEHKWKWVAVDSITGMQELAKRKVISERDLDADPHVTSLQEYGKIGNLLAELVYKFRLLPIHTVWIAQERKHGGGDDGGPSRQGPDILPSALSALMPSMLMVGRMYVGRTSSGDYERRLRLGAHSDYYTKARSKPGAVYPPVVSEPNLKTIIGFLLTGKGELTGAEESELVMLDE